MADIQTDLSAEYKSPLSVGLGFGWQLGKARINASGEWFDAIDPYVVMEGEEFVTQVPAVVQSFDVVHTMDDVLNWAVGVGYSLTKSIIGYGSFATDYSGVTDDIERADLSIAPVDLYTAFLGTEFEVRLARVTIGAGYSWGSRPAEPHRCRTRVHYRRQRLRASLRGRRWCDRLLTRTASQTMHTYDRGTRGPGFTFLTALSATAIGVLPLSGQSAETDTWEISVGQFASVVGGLAVGFIPTIFSINDGLPTCAPCDPATLPAIDRWVVSTERPQWDLVSDVIILVLGAATWYDLSRLPDGNRDVAASVEATAWTFGVNQLAKAIINRNRPVLYSEDAIEHEASVNSHRSMYSGHASTAFAMGTSYYLSTTDKTGFNRTWPLITAAAIAGLRLAAAKHFPTDILVGAALGTVTAIVINSIRF